VEGMERIALVNPAYDYPVTRSRKLPRWNRIWPPLDLANAAAMLRRDGFEPVLVDANAERLGADEVASRVAGCTKVFVTSASLDRWQCPHVDIRGFVEAVRAGEGLRDGAARDVQACGRLEDDQA